MLKSFARSLSAVAFPTLEITFEVKAGSPLPVDWRQIASLKDRLRLGFCHPPPGRTPHHHHGETVILRLLMAEARG